MKQQSMFGKRDRIWFGGMALVALLLMPAKGFCGSPGDPLLDLLIKKGFVTAEEAAKVKGEADAARDGLTNSFPPLEESKWKISKAIKNIELFGDLRLRYEQREAKTPGSQRLELDRGRYAVRLGLRGEAFDDFYYGLRLD